MSVVSALSLRHLTGFQRRVLDSFANRKHRLLDDRDRAIVEALKALEGRDAAVYPTITTLSDALAALDSAAPLTDLVITGANFVGTTVRAFGVSDDASAAKELTWTRVVPGDEDITVRIASSGVANNTVTAAWNETTKILTVTRGTTATAANVVTAIPLDAIAKFIVTVDDTGAAATGVPTAGDITLTGGVGDLLTLSIGDTPVDGTVTGCGITEVAGTTVTFDFDASNEVTESMVQLQLRCNGVLCSVYLIVDEESADIADGAVTTAKFDADALSADAAGRAVIAVDYINNAHLIKIIADGAFQADVATRALFAPAFLPSTKLQTQMVAVALSAAADAGNSVAVTINVTDLEGVAVSRAQRLLCELFTEDMVPALIAAWTLAETGAGTAVSTTANVSLLIDTDANGDATITITDVATGTNANLFLKVTPVSSTNPGFPSIVAINFDT